MTTSKIGLTAETAGLHESDDAVGCPLCGGGVRPQRSGWQCVRCGLAVCEGCEGGVGECAVEG